MMSKLIFSTMPVSVYPADDFLLPEHHLARRDLTPMTPTPVV